MIRNSKLEKSTKYWKLKVLKLFTEFKQFLKYTVVF